MIPKILHIIWIGNESIRPDQLIQTWVQNHPDWEVRLWGNNDLVELDWRCRKQMYELGHVDCAAVANVMRWEILLADGGVCVAADSVCMRPLDEALLNSEAFACWESELGVPGVVSASYFGCHAGNPLVERMVTNIAATQDIATLHISDAVGSGLLTRTWRAMSYSDLTVLPSYSFIPRHPQTSGYSGGGQSYACELWASTMGILDALPGIAPQAVIERLAQSQATAALASAGASSPRPAPLFSIVIPTYNRAATLAEALGSALIQSGDDFEVLVIDDGSTDTTEPLMQRLLEEARAPSGPAMDAESARAIRAKLRVVRQDNLGAAMARNRGVSEARGEYIVWLDSDDALAPNCLALHRRCIEQGRGADVMYGNLVVVNQLGQQTGRLDYPDYADRPLLPDLLVHNRLPNPGTAVRKSLYESIGAYDDKLPASEDYDLWLRAAAVGASFRFVAGDVCHYRIHQGSRSASLERNNVADAQIALKALRNTSLERLFPKLDWSQPVAARAQAFTVATNIFVNRGHWREAAEFAAGVQLCANVLSGEEVLPPQDAPAPQASDASQSAPTTTRRAARSSRKLRMPRQAQTAKSLICSATPRRVKPCWLKALATWLV
jgi:glycosyltransferase involved in cell wall biosynthesis